MKPSSFIDFSYWVVQHADRNLHDYDTILAELTTQFWPATKLRNQRWNRAMDDIEPALKHAKPNDRCWNILLRNCDEIVLSETLARVWFAVIIARTADNDIIDIAQCIIPDHVKVRKRALSMWQGVPGTACEFAQRSNMVAALRDQVNDLLLSQIPEEVVGRNLSISFETFDKFYSCRYDYEPDLLKQANQVLCRSYIGDIAKLSPLDCVNIDLNMQTLKSICSSFEDTEIELPDLVTDAVAG